MIYTENMRAPYILFKRAGHPVYRASFWDEARKRYRPRSVSMLARELKHKAAGLSPTTKSGADAIARLALESGMVGPNDDMLFLAYLEGFWADGSEYLRSREVRQKPLSAEYVKNSRSAISKHLRAFLEETQQSGLTLAQVTPKILETFILWLQTRGIGMSRINASVKAVRVPLFRAAKFGRIRDNPARMVERLPDVAPRRQILELSEARRFFAQPWADPRYHAANFIAATTGLRMGEIRGLQVEDVREDYLHICHNWQDTEPEGRKMKGPKHSTLINIKTRDVPMPPQTAKVIRELIAHNPYRTGFVLWGDTRGKPPSSTTIGKHYKNALAAIGIGEEERERRNLTFHAWRHFYNSNIRPYVPDYQLRMLTGHSGAAMTDRYTAITEEQRQAVASVAAGLLPE